MKILQFVTQMEAAGAQTQALMLQNELQKRGYNVETVFLYKKRQAFEGYSNITCLFEKPLVFWQLPLLPVRIWQKIRSFRPNVVMPYTHWSNALVAPIAKLAGCTVIANQTQTPKNEPRIARMLDCLWGHLGVYVFSISNSEATIHEMKEEISSTYAKRLRLVRLGVETKNIGKTPAAIRQQFGLPTDVPLLLHVGRLSRVKNHQTLLQALKLLPPPVALACVGDGELKDELHALSHKLSLDDRVYWLGERNRDDLFSLLHCADLFVFPSLWEGFGLAPVEAAAAGLPLAVSDIQVFHDVMTLDDGHMAAEMFDPDDAKDMAQKISHMLETPQLLAKLKERSNKLGEKYSVQQMTDAYETCLRDAEA